MTTIHPTKLAPWTWKEEAGSPRRSLLLTAAAVFVVALAARLAYLALRGPVVTWDSGEYLRLARNLLEHGAYSLETAPPFAPSIRRAPLYPWFLALLGWGGGAGPVLVATVQALLDAGTAVMLLFLARMALPGRWAAGTALAWALYPGAIATSTAVLSETLFTAALVAGVTAVAAGVAKNRVGLTAVGGAALGLAALCRPVALLLPMVLLGALWVAATEGEKGRRGEGVRGRQGAKKRVDAGKGGRTEGAPPRQSVTPSPLLPFSPSPLHPLHALLLLAGAALIVAPWALRCSRVAHHLVVVQGMSAANFYVATLSGWDQLDEARLWPRFSREDRYGRWVMTARSPAEIAAADRYGFRWGLENIRANPRRYLLSRLRSFPPFFLSSFDFFTGIRQSFGQALRTRSLAILMLKLFLLLLASLSPFLLGLVGLTQTRHSAASALCAAVWVYFWLIHLPMWVEYRYWLPAVPFLLVSAAAGTRRIRGIFMHRASSSAQAALACLALFLGSLPAHALPLDRTPNPNLRKLYRFRHGADPYHVYTANSGDRFQLLDGGFSSEGVLGQLQVAPVAASIPLYGLTLANGDGILTTDESEAAELRSRSGTVYQGLLGYAYSSAPASVPSIPLFRLRNLASGFHVFTTDVSERDRLLTQSYVLQQSALPVYAYLVYDLGDTRPLFIAPVHEHAYTDGRTLTELRRMKQILAPSGGGPSVRLGWTKSYWYLKDGGAGSVLDDILGLAHSAPIPVVVILNGGRWMADNPDATQLDTLRRFGESIPLYRITYLRQGSTLVHLITTDTAERNSGLNYDGVIAGIYRSQVDGTVPFYRILLPGVGDHIFTMDSSERSKLLRQGGKDEGIKGYVFPVGNQDTVPLYRLYNPTTLEHLYTTDPQERTQLLNAKTFQDQGTACYVHPFPLTTLNQDDLAIFYWNPGKQFVSLSRLNTLHYRQKQAALTLAAQRIATWARANPNLLVAVTIDSETLLNDNPSLGYTDYNPAVLQEWRQWMANTGIYDPVNGQYKGQGHNPPLTLVDIGGMTGIGHSSWNDVMPPRTNNGTLFWQIWREFSRQMVADHNQDMADWIAAGGIPRQQIFAHQTPDALPEFFGDTLQTAILHASDGTPLTGGITAFGANAAKYSLFQSLIQSGVGYWGLFEYNPNELGNFGVTTSYQQAMDSLFGVAASEVSIIAPYQWPTDSLVPSASIEGTPFQAVITDFIGKYGSVLR